MHYYLSLKESKPNNSSDGLFFNFRDRSISFTRKLKSEELIKKSSEENEKHKMFDNQRIICAVAAVIENAITVIASYLFL